MQEEILGHCISCTDGLLTIFQAECIEESQPMTFKSCEICNQGVASESETDLYSFVAILHEIHPNLNVLNSS